MTIYLHEILPIFAPEKYKIHFARINKENVDPLDVFARDRDEWQGWQEHRPKHNDFNRPFIFALAHFPSSDKWLFGGIYRVEERHPHPTPYVVELTDQAKGFIGRLILRSDYQSRAARVDFENHYPNLEVAEILREPYSG